MNEYITRKHNTSCNFEPTRWTWTTQGGILLFLEKFPLIVNVPKAGVHVYFRKHFFFKKKKKKEKEIQNNIIQNVIFH